MESQIENAIGIAWDPSSGQELKVQAFNFLNQIRSTPSGQQACVSLFMKVPRCSDVVRLVCLDVINNLIQSQVLDIQSIEQLIKTFLEYIRQTYTLGDQEITDPAHIQKKLSQTLTFLFIKTYNHDWKSFFEDILSITGLQNDGAKKNVSGTMLYLRILGSIHDEIADVVVMRTCQDNKRNSELKDTMRARDVPNLVTSWQEIILRWQGQNDVIEMCLKVIGKWTSWIDISLIMNQNLLSNIFQLIGRTNADNKENKVRDAAISALTEMVAKKMKPSDKIAMIIFLNLGQLISQIIASQPLNDLRMTPNYDTDLAELIAKLINSVVLDVVKILDDPQIQTQTQLRIQAEELIQTFLPLVLRFLSDEYDEICCTVIPSVTEFLTFLRKSKPIPMIYSSMLTQILNIVIQKMRYDDTSFWGNEDEMTDEAEFQELRKRLQTLQKGVAAVDELLYVETLSNVVANIFQTLEQQNGLMNWRDLDLALQEINIFGEISLKNSALYTKNHPSSVAAEHLIVMISKMIDSDIASFSHPAVKLQYVEICVRYCSFFENQTMYIPHVLEQFVQIIHHDHVRVRTRSWYLFLRFVKHLRAHIGNIAETVIQSINDLLQITAKVLNKTTTDEISSEDSDYLIDTTFNAQLYLFEAIGCISSASIIPAEKQVLHVRGIIDPLFLEIEKDLELAKSGNLQAILQIHHVIMALGALAHGFSDWKPGNLSTAHNAPSREAREEFSRVAEVILIALEVLKSSLDVRTAARVSFTRLIGVLGADMLQFLPRWIDGLLSESSSRDEIALFLRLLDQIIFSFKKDIYDVLNALLTPLLQRVFSGLNEPITGTDDELQLTDLRREYLTLIQVIFNNELGLVFTSDLNQRFLEQLIISIINIARSVSNEMASLVASRLAFSVITNMAQFWGGPDIVIRSHQASTSIHTSQQPIPGFDKFLIEQFHHLCWEVLRQPIFKPAVDAQCKQVLNEIAGLQQTIYVKMGDVFLQYLQQEFFPAIGTDGSDFVKILKTSSDRKFLAKYLQEFLIQKNVMNRK